MRAFSLLAFLILVPAASADISGPTTVNAKVGRLATVTLTHDCDEIDYALLGDAADGFREFDAEAKRIKLRVIGYEPGTAYLVAWGTKAGKLVPKHVVTINVVAGPSPVPPVPPGPVPPGPVPPGPTPPVPPGPTPDPPTPPIPGDGLYMLIVYEEKDLATYPSAQVAAMNSGKVTEYLKAKGAGDKWRIWDQNTDVTGESQVWRLAFNRKRDKLPWIVVSNGKTGWEGPLPANTDELLKLLKKFGGE